ncbi:MAG: glycosyltransferase [Vulcanimicrobiota bacterium]
MSTNRLHIAHYTNVYKPILNGVAVSVESFRSALGALGHQVYVFAPAAGDYRDLERFIVRYPAFDLPMQKYPIAVPVSPAAESFLELAKPDLLHAHHPAILGRAALHHAERHGLPLVFTYHTRYHDYSHYAAPFPKDKVDDLITHWIGHFMACCHRVVVPSQSIKVMVEQLYGLSEGVEVVATGVDSEHFRPGDRGLARLKLGWPESDLVLISVGRLAKEKNFTLLLESVSLLTQTEVEWRLVIVGEGDERQALEQAARDFGVSERVEFVGQVEFLDMPLYLQACDLFCFASLTETQGLATLEAMATGLAVVAVKASGTSDVMTSGREGFLTDPSPAALAKSIRYMLEHPEFRQACAQKAIDTAGGCTPLKQAERLVEVYRQAIEANRRGITLHPYLQSHWSAFLEFAGLD